MKIGLFGGSFDPAHDGHAHVAETALKRLGLDQVWWLVSPQNPLKPKSSLFEKRLQSARAWAHGRKMVVTDLERRLDCTFTYQTLRALKRRYPGVAFTLIMGADNLTHFRKWRNWREVAASIPVAIISRPGSGPRARLSAPKYWTFLPAPYHTASSTALRARRKVAKQAPK